MTVLNSLHKIKPRNQRLLSGVFQTGSNSDFQALVNGMANRRKFSISPQEYVGGNFSNGEDSQAPRRQIRISCKDLIQNAAEVTGKSCCSG